VANAAGCRSTTTLVIDQTGSGGGAVPTLSASSSAVCEGSNVTVFVSSTATNYQWYLNGTAVSGQTSATLNLAGVQPSQSGNYVLASNGGACGSFTTTAFSLTVNPLPTVVILFPNSVTAVGPNTVFGVVTVQTPFNPFTAQVTGGVWYEWMWIVDRLNGYEIRCGSSNNTGLFEVGMLKEFRVTVTTEAGCQRVVRGLVRTP
jgi:hypothetical protein